MRSLYGSPFFRRLGHSIRTSPFGQRRAYIGYKQSARLASLNIGTRAWEYPPRRLHSGGTNPFQQQMLTSVCARQGHGPDRKHPRGQPLRHQGEPHPTDNSCGMRVPAAEVRRLQVNPQHQPFYIARTSSQERLGIKLFHSRKFYKGAFMGRRLKSLAPHSPYEKTCF